MYFHWKSWDLNNPLKLGYLYLFCLFSSSLLSPVTPLQTGFKLIWARGEARFSTFYSKFCLMCVCYRSQLIRKRSKAVEISWRKHKHKKNNNNLLPGQIIYQRSGISSVYSLRHRQIETTDYTVFSSQPKVGGDIRASHITAHSVYLLFDDPKMSQLIFIFLIF